MPGRKATPTAIKVLRGNPGKRPLNVKEAKPLDKIPPCPSHLNAEGKREWKRIVKKLRDCGLFTYVDKAMLATYCQAWGRWVEAEKEVNKHGAIVKTVNGNLIQNPYLSVANRAMKQLQTLAREFGMSPSSRSNIKADVPDKQPSLAEQLFQSIENV